jgi:hypothetical protein
MFEQFVAGSLTLDKRIMFAPTAGHLVFLPPGNDRLVYRKFDLKDALDQTEQEYLLVLSNPPLRAKAGSAWEYKVATLAKNEPVKFKLEKAPEGMTLSPEGGLAWKVPGGIEGKARVVVAIADAKGNAMSHGFTIGFE